MSNTPAPVFQQQVNMMTLLWRKHLSVGNALLDNEHKNLIGMVNSIEYAIHKKDMDSLLKKIKLFKDDAGIHFANEARFAQALHSDFEQHEIAHQHLLKELQQTVDELDVRAGGWPDYVMDYYPQFLRDWLIEHISGEDMKMKPVLQSHPYDFKPI